MTMPQPVIEERKFAALVRRRLKQKFDKPAGTAVGEPVGAGLIGAGNFARWSYVPRLKRGYPFKLAAVFDTDRALAEKVAAETGARACASLEELLKAGAVRAVFICTPVKYHYEGALAALRAGKHVLCEKPLGFDCREARALREEARKAGKANMVHFSHRFIAPLAYLAELIQAGVIGRVYHATGTFSQGLWFDENGAPARERDDAADWKFGAQGGVLQDLGPHLIDCCRMFFGEISTVQAWMKSLRPGPFVADDACGLTLNFAGGAVAQLVTSRWATGQKNRIALEISGSLGMVQYEDGVIRLWTRADPRWQTLLLPAAKPPDFFEVFHRAILDPKAPLPNFDDGVKNNEALEAIIESAKSGVAVSLAVV